MYVCVYTFARVWVHEKVSPYKRFERKKRSLKPHYGHTAAHTGAQAKTSTKTQTERETDTDTLTHTHLCVLEVVPPEGADLVLTTDIPHSEGNVLVLHSLHVEACSVCVCVCVRVCVCICVRDRRYHRERFGCK